MVPTKVDQICSRLFSCEIVRSRCLAAEHVPRGPTACLGETEGLSDPLMLFHFCAIKAINAPIGLYLSVLDSSFGFGFGKNGITGSLLRLYLMEIFTFRGYQSYSSVGRAVRKPEERLHNSFLRFLSIAIALGVNVYPLTWRAALEDLGEGSTGQVSQAPLNARISFAYKRFTRVNRNPEISNTEFRMLQYDAMVSEMVVLSSNDIYEHPNIVNLEGVCWENIPESEEIWPVLIFRKAEGGDLRRFLSSPEAAVLGSDELITVCGEVAKALSIMHRCGSLAQITHFKSLSALRTPGRYNSRRHKTRECPCCEGIRAISLWSQGDGLWLFMLWKYGK